MNVQLKEVSEQPGLFFNLLPDDWREEIEPVWNNYHQSARIFNLVSDKKHLGGGIVFSTVSPDMMFASDVAEEWFAKGYLYLGYIYIVKKKRGEGFGSQWLRLIIQSMPGQKFWLTIEDFNLMYFYIQNGFVLTGELNHGKQNEWVMVFN